MKTVAFFKEEIEKLRSKMADAKKQLDSPRVNEEYAKQLRGTIKRNKKRMEEYTFYMRYAETSPNKDFLQKEVERLTNRINKFIETYVSLDETKFDKKTCSAHKRNYEKDMGILKLRKQMTAINFLLR